MERRDFIVGAATATALVLTTSRAGATEVSMGVACDDSSKCLENSKAISNRAELEDAFSQLGKLSEAQVKQLATVSQANSLNGRGPSHAPQAVPIVAIGVKTLISCALSAAWVFRDGKTNRNNVIKRVAEVIVGCLGIPGLTSGTCWLLRLIWTHRKKIAAALSALGLTAAQLAPLRNARRP